MINAFKESIKTKDELIFKFYENFDVNSIQPSVVELKKKNFFDSEGFLIKNKFFLLF